jgi:hypothetical protein
LGTLVERFPRGVFKKKKIVIANLFLGTSGNIGLVGFVLFGYCEQTTYLLYESQIFLGTLGNISLIATHAN